MLKEPKSKLENTIFEAREENGEIKYYRIYPEKGYKLHEKSLDRIFLDADGNETGEREKGFTSQYTTAGIDYDFSTNPREIYAVEDADDEL